MRRLFLKKGEVYEGIIERVSFPNKGIVTIGDQRVTVKNGMPGQRVRFRIHKKRRDRVEGQLLEVLEHSPLETQTAGCSLFPQCGGCLYQTMSYDAQVDMKKKQLIELFQPVVRTDHFEMLFEGIRCTPSQFGYRNKMEFAFGDAEKDGPLTLGLHRKNSTYDILPVTDCRLVHDDFNRIVQCTLQFFSERKLPYLHKMTHEGYLRHLLIRRAETTGEILIDLVTTSQNPGCDKRELLEEFTQRLLQTEIKGAIVGILHTTNDALSDIIRNDKTDVLFGTDSFEEQLLGLRFRISPFSFFQTNSRGAEILYETAREYLGGINDQTVFDLYSGTGTIAQMLAPVAKKVVGVEIVEEAVEAAVENAALNGLENCEFIAGDVLKVLDTLRDRPDTIVLDPPRDGIHPKALPKIIAYGVERIVYISCKPSSLARDLEVLQDGGYRVERMCGVDMFPNTQHVETVVLLTRNT